MYTSEQVINGLMAYADNEVIPKLGTSGKWIIGTLVGMIGAKTGTLMQEIQSNQAAKIIGAVDNNGLFDIDLIADHLKQSVQRYGNLQIALPMLGTMTFTADDVEKAIRYIKGA